MTETLQTAYNVMCAVYESGDIGPALKFARTATTLVGSTDAPNGHYFGGAEFGTLKRDFGRTTSADILKTEINISLARNTDGQQGIGPDNVRLIFDANMLTDARLVLWESVDGTRTQIFEGYISRGDVEITRDEVTIVARDRMANEDVPLCRIKLDESVSDTWRGDVLPVVFGDWSHSLYDDWIECPVTNDDNTGGDIAVRVSAVGNYGIEQNPRSFTWWDSGGAHKANYQTAVFAVGIDVPALAVASAADTYLPEWGAALAVAGIIDSWTDDNENEYSLKYWVDGDVIRARGLRGQLGWNVDSASAVSVAASCVKNPVDIIYTLLRDTSIGMSVSAAAIDLPSFWECRGYLAAFNVVARAWIHDAERTVIDVIGSLCLEFNLKLWTDEDGLYHLTWIGFRMRANLSPDTIITARNILSWSLKSDADREAFDALRLSYCDRPGEGPTRVYDSGDYDDTPRDKSFELQSEWIYESNGADYFGAIWPVNHRGDLMRLTITVDPTGAQVATMGGYVRVINDVLDAVYQVVSIEKNLSDGTAKLGLSAMGLTARAGLWSDDVGEAAPTYAGGGIVPANWTAATADQREKMSFWADDDGLMPDGSDGKVWNL